MNIRDLKYLVAVADLCHFGRAAEACFVSQPTLSGQIKKLEEELGVTLLERTQRSVVPTPIGRRIVERARSVIETVESIETLARTEGDPLAGPLRVGAIHTISPYLTPLILRPLAERHPRMHLVLSEDVTGSLLKRLGNHELDAAILATAESNNELTEIPLYDEPFWFAQPAGTRRDGAVGHAELESTELLLLEDGHCFADQVLALCRSGRGLREEDRGELRAASLETLVRLVGRGFGTTLIPALAIHPAALAESGVAVRPIPMEGARRRVTLVYRRSFPRVEALTALAEVIRATLPEGVHLAL